MKTRWISWKKKKLALRREKSYIEQKDYNTSDGKHTEKGKKFEMQIEILKEHINKIQKNKT